ncbi:hypothetical protein F4802DRAFT_594815 [Xylaria palmicola]|nr:hypothetical protein F4802DRAFT_594815 [Xylaria palmicola]
MAGGGLGSSTTVRSAMITHQTGRAHGGESEEDELSLPTVTSDVLKAPQHRTKATLSSVAGRPQSPSSSPRVSGQMALPTSPPSQSPSRMRLAVHIRSSPVSPFRPINAPASRVPATLSSRLGRNREQPVRAEKPRGPSTPGSLVGLEVKAGASSSEPKKRGRPKGRKSGTPYTMDPNSRFRKREARAAESQVRAQTIPGQDKGRGQNQNQSQSQDQEPKRRGRPPRPPEPSIRERYLQSKPDYMPYKCEWDVSEDLGQRESSICPAELHNMDTLRRHVLFVHGDRDQLVCRFSRCRDRNPPLQFETDDEFQRHMECKHFAAYLWHLGEGYQNNGIETLAREPNKLPAYLFDKHGNQVTPWVRDQRLESDLQHKARKRRLRRLLELQNENAPSEEEWRKQMLGIA